MQESGTVQSKSRSIACFVAGGVRADPVEMFDAAMYDLQSRMAADWQKIDSEPKGAGEH